jgi:hypothetical protein
MEKAMYNEDDVSKHYNKFLDLANPLLHLHHLSDDECGILFGTVFTWRIMQYSFTDVPNVATCNQEHTLPFSMHFTQHATSFLL